MIMRTIGAKRARFHGAILVEILRRLAMWHVVRVEDMESLDEVEALVNQGCVSCENGFCELTEKGAHWCSALGIEVGPVAPTGKDV
jgi:predicted methyltransferase